MNDKETEIRKAREESIDSIKNILDELSFEIKDIHEFSESHKNFYYEIPNLIEKLSIVKINLEKSIDNANCIKKINKELKIMRYGQ